MLNRIADFFWRIAGWKTFLAGLLLDMFFNLVILPWGSATFNKLSDKQVQVMDLKFSYSPEIARTIIGDYSPAARNFAIKFGLIADTLYPMAYTFFFIITAAWILKALAGYNIRIKYLHLFPGLILAADYLENLNIANLMALYPNFSDTQVYISSFFTSLKWSLVGILMAIILSALVALAGVRFLKRNI